MTKYQLETTPLTIDTYTPHNLPLGHSEDFLICLRASLLSAAAWLSVLAAVRAERKDMMVKVLSDVLLQLEIGLQALRAEKPHQVLEMLGAGRNARCDQPLGLSDDFSRSCRDNLLAAAARLQLAVQSSGEERIIIWEKNGDVCNQLEYLLESFKEIDPNGIVAMIKGLAQKQKPKPRKGHRTR